jgi:uncharacterized membrane protein YcaP (DUF421 family)
MDILVPEIAVAEKILRSVVVYGLLLVAFRMAGKRAALRKEGIATMSEVRYAILEEDGHVSVIPRRFVSA